MAILSSKFKILYGFLLARIPRLTEFLFDPLEILQLFEKTPFSIILTHNFSESNHCVEFAQIWLDG